MARILGLDYGLRRLGFALSDPTELLASTHSMKTCTSDDEAVAAVLGVLQETEAEKLVVGLPLSMDGSHSEFTKQVVGFVDKLKTRVSVPVETWDERLTTKSAHDALIEAGTSRKKRKGLVDKVAAQIMLQNYLDARGAGEAEWDDGMLE